MHIGSSYDYTGKPVVVRCPNEAEETVMMGWQDVWACHSCIEYYSKHYPESIKRNPRIYGDSRS